HHRTGRCYSAASLAPGGDDDVTARHAAGVLRGAPGGREGHSRPPPPGAGRVLDGHPGRCEPGLVSVDAVTFERLSAGAETADLEQAAALFRGDLLEGIDGVGEAFETWLMAERGRLRNRAVGVLDRLLAVRM